MTADPREPTIATPPRLSDLRRDDAAFRRACRDRHDAKREAWLATRKPPTLFERLGGLFKRRGA